VIDAIRSRREPSFDEDDEALVYRFCRELLGERSVSAETYAAAVELLGEAGVVELVSLQGYYGLVSMLLNTFEVPLPEGVAPIQ
jgi:4-carboxymuconolactone decarboxylase